MSAFLAFVIGMVIGFLLFPVVFSVASLMTPLQYLLDEAEKTLKKAKSIWPR